MTDSHRFVRGLFPTIAASACACALLLAGSVAIADDDDDADDDDKNGKNGKNGKDTVRCHPALPTHTALRSALKKVVAELNGGFDLDMWAAVVNRDGVVCVVVFSGEERGDQWPGSRVISAQKANTANAFSLKGLPLSTANLYSASQPGGTLFGLPVSNPVDTSVAYKGPSSNYGKPNDPMVGSKIGGVCVFGGGLALYETSGNLIGGLGVSGDSSCADHNVAWKVRHALNLDSIPGGVTSTGDDNIVYDIVPDADGNPVSVSGWGHPSCSAAANGVSAALPVSHPVGPAP